MAEAVEEVEDTVVGGFGGAHSSGGFSGGGRSSGGNFGASRNSGYGSSRRRILW